MACKGGSGAFPKKNRRGRLDEVLGDKGDTAAVIVRPTAARGCWLAF